MWMGLRYPNPMGILPSQSQVRWPTGRDNLVLFMAGSTSPGQALSVEPDSSGVDSILKSRDITLATKVRLSKAMVSPVVDLRVGL